MKLITHTLEHTPNLSGSLGAWICLCVCARAAGVAGAGVV
jgi:hypothetical protein